MTDNNCWLIIDPSPAELKRMLKRLPADPAFCLHLLVQSRYKSQLAHRYNFKIKTFAELDFFERRGGKPLIKGLAHHINNKQFQKVYIKERLVSNYFWLWLRVNVPLKIFTGAGELKVLNLNLYFRELIKYIFNKYILFLIDIFINLFILPLNTVSLLFYRLGDWLTSSRDSSSISMDLFVFCKFVSNSFLERKKFGNRDQDNQKWKNKTKVYRRYWSALFRQYPDFILPGVEKCGLTTFLTYINSHPQTTAGLRKEIGYFSADDRYRFGDCWYRSWFPLKSNLKRYLSSSAKKRIIYEGTGDYFTAPGVARRMHFSLPRARFILLFRNPVLRAYSDYHFRGKRELIKRKPDINSDNINFKKALDYELNLLPDLNSIENIEELYNFDNKKRFRALTCFRQGLYYIHLKSWLNYFSRDQFLIIKSKNLFEKNRKTLQRVSDFLKIDSFNNLENVHKNEGNYPPLKEKDSQHLKELYKPFNHKLYELIGRNLGWEEEI